MVSMFHTTTICFRNQTASCQHQEIPTYEHDIEDIGMIAYRVEHRGHVSSRLSLLPATDTRPRHQCSRVQICGFSSAISTYNSGKYLFILFKIKAKGQYWPLTCNTNHDTMFDMQEVSIKTNSNMYKPN